MDGGGSGATHSTPRDGEAIHMMLTPRKGAKRLRLVIQDPNGLIEGVEIARGPVAPEPQENQPVRLLG